MTTTNFISKIEDIKKVHLKNIISASILSADFLRLGDEIKALTCAGVDWIHIDVMDGQFVPNLTIGPKIIEEIRTLTNLPLDVHLMVYEPQRHINAFSESGATSITVHIEACSDIRKTISCIREYGKKVGVSLKPSTPVSVIAPILDDVDIILVMSVEPGFGGQAFIQGTLERISDIKRMIRERDLCVSIEVDGGIRKNNIREISLSGADIFVVGSGIFLEEDYSLAVRTLRSQILDEGAGHGTG